MIFGRKLKECRPDHGNVCYDVINMTYEANDKQPTGRLHGIFLCATIISRLG